MKKNVKIYKLILLLIVVVVLLCACSKEIDFTSMIDSENNYEEKTLSHEQEEISLCCKIERYYVSNNRKIFKVYSENGYVGRVHLLVLLEDTTVLEIKGIDIKESENYGTKCFQPRFLSQFEGLDLAQIETIKGRATSYDDGEVTYVTNATKTSKAIIEAVNAVALFLKTYT